MGTDRARLRLALLRIFAALARPLHPARPPALPAKPRILLIRPDHIGDLLFATPVLRVLRSAFPDAHLTGMVGPWAEAVWKNSPHLDKIIACSFPAFARRPKTSLLAPYRQVQRWATTLRPKRFDMAIVLRFDHWWGALLTYMAGIPRRLGYAIPECQPFLTHAVPYTGLRHEVLQNLTLIEQTVREAGRCMPEDLSGLEFRIAAEDRAHVATYLAERGITADHDLVAIHPGAGAPVKQWEPESFAKLADAISRRRGDKIIITGSREELDLAWSIHARMRYDPVVAAGETSLGQLAALFERCRLVIGPDCGPLHLAVTVGTPTVHLYGPVDPRKFGPWGESERHRVIASDRECVPCNRLDYSPSELPDHPCVREIAVESVLETTWELLRKGLPRSTEPA